jgi:hypothetical protein
VLQAWDAAHGRSRDLVIGITGPDGFRAHAWLDGDPTPAADEAELTSPALDMSRARRYGNTARDEPNATAAADGNGSLTLYTELLRRPAPDYGPRPAQKP